MTFRCSMKQVLFSFSADLGQALGDANGSHSIGIGFAVIAFCMMDLSINTIQVLFVVITLSFICQK